MITALILSIITAAHTTTCTRSVAKMTAIVDKVTDSASENLTPSALTYADFLFDDDTEMFEELATHDPEYTLTGVTFMWDRSPSVVYVVRVRPAREGEVCIETYNATVVRRYAGGIKLPDVQPYD